MACFDTINIGQIREMEARHGVEFVIIRQGIKEAIAGVFGEAQTSRSQLNINAVEHCNRR